MEGRYIYFDQEENTKALKGLNKKQLARSPHCHIEFHLNDGSSLLFEDFRKFGTMELVEPGQQFEYPSIKHLGPEANVPSSFTGKYLQDVVALKSPNRPIKNVLLDQTVVAGIGNIYACEVLYRTGIHPLTAIGQLSQQQLAKVAQQTWKILAKAILLGGTSARTFGIGAHASKKPRAVEQDYSILKGDRAWYKKNQSKSDSDQNSDEEIIPPTEQRDVTSETIRPKTGSFQLYLQVYGRKGKPCFKCNEPIIKIKVAGRGTQLCPACQSILNESKVAKQIKQQKAPNLKTQKKKSRKTEDQCTKSIVNDANQNTPLYKTVKRSPKILMKTQSIDTINTQSVHIASIQSIDISPRKITRRNTMPNKKQ